jgi:hypothetical protein
MGEGRAVSIMSPRVLQAFLWPVHNVFLCTWICLILATTYLGSLVMMCQTLLFGAKRTNAPLGRLFMEEVHPGARAVEALCEQHQAIGVRVAGLALMPLMMLCDLSTSVVGRMGVLAGSLVFVGMGLCSWWYWVRFHLFCLCVLLYFLISIWNIGFDCWLKCIQLQCSYRHVVHFPLLDRLVLCPLFSLYRCAYCPGLWCVVFVSPP